MKQRDSDEEIQQIENENTIDKKVRLMPKKADFRMHAHVNPLNETLFPFPLNPNYVDWSLHYPFYFGKQQYDKIHLNTLEYPNNYVDVVSDQFNGKNGVNVQFLDIGCGFGGLTFALSENFSDKLTLGLEIRGKVVNFVGEKIRAIRIESNFTKCNNVSVIRTNAMRHLPQVYFVVSKQKLFFFFKYFRKGTIEKIFICFPDPHFKARNHRRRIVNAGLLSEYAFLLKPKGRIYCITDVKDLHDWHVEHLEQHSMFKRISEEEVQSDICSQLIWNQTEEGKKVERNKGSKFSIVCERI